MIPYLLISLMPIVIYPFFRFQQSGEVIKNKKRNYLIVCGIILFLFLALRSRFIGSTDTVNYYNMMKRAISSDSWGAFYISDGVETGFQIYVFLLSRIFNNAQWLLVVSSAICVISICYFVYHNSADSPFSMVMYITLGMMTFQMQGMRQAIAMSICLVAFECAKRKKLLWFILINVFAIQFHQTAIVFLPIYIIVQMRYGLINFFILILVSIIVLSLSTSIVSFGNQLFDKDYSYTLDGGGIVATLIYVAIIVFSILVNNNLRTDKTQSALLYVTCMGFVCYIMRYTGVAIAERVSFYFMFGQLAILINSMKKMAQEEFIITKWVVYLLMILLFMYRLMDSDLIPYTFYWNI